MARRDTETFAARLRRISEEALSTLFDEFKTNRGMRTGLDRASERLKENKGVFDRNLEILLDLANLPSKRDFRELRERIERLTGQVVNLNLKLDRLLSQPGAGVSAHTRREGQRKRDDNR